MMRKRVLGPASKISQSGRDWIDVDRAAAVEVTSEDKDYPVEAALLSSDSPGWRASEPGPQTVRLVFDEPQALKYIALVFEETEMKRTQEFVLRWSRKGDDSYREIVRQQWNFSPPETAGEVQEYQVNLPDVARLELIISPDISGGAARASLKVLRLA